MLQRSHERQPHRFTRADDDRRVGRVVGEVRQGLQPGHLESLLQLGGGVRARCAQADRQGPARSLVIGTILFAAGMAVSGVADGMPGVITGRAIQGFGSGAIGSVVYAAIARAYTPDARPRMIALVSSAWVVPGLVGPALAGLLIVRAHGVYWAALCIGGSLLGGVAFLALRRRLTPAQDGAVPAETR